MIPRREWLAMLARMSTPHDPVKAVEAMLHYLPLLSDMPEAAFTPASLEAVAMSPQNLHIRTLREVKEPLQAWWRDNGPRRVALPAPPPEPEPQVSPEERAAVARQLKELADTMAMRQPEERRQVRAHVVPVAHLAEARERLRKGVGGGVA